jgi:HK97 family phage portal protein
MGKKKTKGRATNWRPADATQLAPPALPPFGPTGDLAGLFGGYFGASMDTIIEHIGTAERCEQLACQQLASMVLRTRPHDVRWRAWLANPDPGHLNGISEAIWQMAWSLYRRGETFLWVTSRYADDYPASWLVLEPVAMDVDEIDGELEFRSNGLHLDSEDVLWIKRNPYPGYSKRRGSGALQSYWSSLASAWASERHSATVLDGSGVPAAVIKHAQRLTKEKAQDLQADWVNAVRSRMGAPAVLSEGLDFSILSWSPRDLMLLELREFDAKAIASAYGVPAFLLNLPQADGLNYSNPTNLFKLWWQAELMPMGRRMEVGLSTWLPSGQSIEFDPRVLLRPDFEVQVRAMVSLLEKDVVTFDEVREAVLDLPPISETQTLELLDTGPPGQQSSSALVDPRIPIVRIPGGTT